MFSFSNVKSEKPVSPCSSMFFFVGGLEPLVEILHFYRGAQSRREMQLTLHTVVGDYSFANAFWKKGMYVIFEL